MGNKDPFRIASSRERHDDIFIKIDLSVECTIIEREKIEKVWPVQADGGETPPGHQHDFDV